MGHSRDTDVCVIGGGIIGTSIAYFLSRICTDVTLISRGEPGSAGATSISKGILRVYDPQPSLVKLAQTGVDFYLRWSEQQQLGEAPIKVAGILYRLARENVARARAEVAATSSGSYPIHLVPYAEVKSPCDRLAWDDTDHVIFEPRGGYGDPRATAHKLAQAAKHNGAVVLTTGVDSIQRGPGGGWIVTHSNATIQCRIVVAAAGAAILDLLPHAVCRVRSIPSLIFRSPASSSERALIDEVTETYVRPLSKDRFATGSGVVQEGHWRGLPTHPSVAQVIDATDRLSRLFHPDEDLHYLGGEVGCDGYTADLLPLVGEAGLGEGLYIAAGLSGRGYKLAPAIGMGLSQMIATKLGNGPLPNLPHVDLADFSPDRFR